MIKQKLSYRLVMALVSLFAGMAASAATYNVSSVSALQSAINSAAAGDVLILADGTYLDSTLTVGTNNITIRASTPGGVILNGTNEITLSGNYITFSGFQFRSGSITGNVINVSGHNNTLTQLNFNGYTAQKYINIQGRYVEVSYSNFEDKPIAAPIGNLVHIEPDGIAPSYIKIRYCSFRNMSGPGGDYGNECIRIANGLQSAFTCRTVVEFCYFENTGGGDGEAISVKCRENVLRYNTFTNNQNAMMVFRNGDNNVAYGNFFIGAAGIRVKEANNIYCYNNYFENSAVQGALNPVGYSFISPNLININFIHNTFVDCGPIDLDTGATTNTWANNLFKKTTGNIFQGSASGISWAGNIHQGTLGITIPSGMSSANPRLALNTDGYYGLSSNSPAINAASANYPAILDIEGIDDDPSLMLDGSGQPRPAGATAKDVGSDEYTTGTTTNRPLVLANVGPSYLGGPNGNPVAPAISTPPLSQSVSVGSAVTFTVVASGTAPLSYQWKKNGVDISGATFSSYVISAVQVADAAGYTVVASNVAGAITSAVATLTVIANTPPAITTQPQNQTVTAGSSVTFTVAASGTAPLSYQWTKDGLTIAGATSASYNIAAVQAGDAGDYAVVVTNVVGSVTSAASALTVNPASLPAPWVSTDIGQVGMEGGASADAGVYTINGSGTGITSTSDQFRYVYQTLSGDGSITARLNSQSGTSTNSLAGVMIRENTNTVSRFASVLRRGSGSNNIRAIRRTSPDGTLSSNQSTSQTPPNCWMRVTRTGNSFTMQSSTNGTTWSEIATVTITMATEITVGLVVSSGSNATLDTDLFDNVSVVALSINTGPYSWDGGNATSPNWGAAANWVGDAVPTFNNTADVTFYAAGTTTQLTNAINGDRTLRSLSFNADTDAGVSIRTRNAIDGTQVGRTLTFASDAGNATITVNAGATGAHTISGGAVTASSVATGGAILLSSSLDVVHNGTGIFTLGQANDGVTALSETPITGAGTLNKSGTGELTLAGPNTFAGGVNVYGGRVNVAHNNALGTGAVTLAGTGAELRLSTSGVSTPAANSLTVSDTGNTKTLSGVVSSGFTSFGGDITIEESTDGNFSINVGANASLTISGTISGTGAAGLKKAGAGNLILTGTNNNYTGPTTVSGGMLTLTNPSLDDLSTVNIATGATLNLSHANTDRVAGIVIDGLPSAPGIYKAVGAAGAGTELNVLLGTGKLQIGAGSATFASWMAGYTFEGGADLSAAGDADHDGIANLTEHVFGTAPNAATAGTSPLTASSVSATFTHPLNPAIVSGVTYEYQWSTDLAEWCTSGVANASGVIAIITPSVPVANVVTFTVTVPTGSTAKLFTRLVASSAP